LAERDPVDQGDRRERLRVEDHADALDARLAADGHELDDGMARRRGRHHEQLAAADREGAARRVGLGVEARQQRGLERVDRRRRAQATGDLRRVEEGQAHRRTKPVPSGSRASSTKRCSPVR
jgi:hypothetical protein